jgi:hypothetical protein
VKNTISWGGFCLPTKPVVFLVFRLNSHTCPRLLRNCLAKRLQALQRGKAGGSGAGCGSAPSSTSAAGRDSRQRGWCGLLATWRERAGGNCGSGHCPTGSDTNRDLQFQSAPRSRERGDIPGDWPLWRIALFQSARPTFNAQRSTPNVLRPTFYAQRSTFKGGRQEAGGPPPRCPVATHLQRRPNRQAFPYSASPKPPRSLRT